jgi:hypothetical protein
MRNWLLIIIQFACFFQLFRSNAEETILLSFGANTDLDSIIVENLSKESSVVLKGNYSLLLKLEWPTSVDISTNKEMLSYYPNPFADRANLEFNSIADSEIEMAVYNLAGTMIASTKRNILPGNNRFIFSPNSPGTYLLKAKCNSTEYSAKLICLQSNSGHSYITYAGPVSAASFRKNNINPTPLKSNDGLNASIGDLLQFTAYSAKRAKTIFDVVNTDKNYEFTFDDGYLILKKHILEESYPSFVDVILSVSDSSCKGIEYLDIKDFLVSEDGLEIDPKENFLYLLKKDQITTSLKNILLIDNSLESSSSLEAIKSAAIKFVETMNEDQEVAIYTFSDSTQIRLNYSKNKTLLKVMINTIRSSTGNRNLSGALITGLSGIDNVYSLSEVTQGSLLLFTASMETNNDLNRDDVLNHQGDKRFYSLVFGEKNDSAFQKMLYPEDYFHIQNLDYIDAVIANIQSDILKLSGSFYRLNYMTGQREGKHSLRISVRDNINSDTTSFVSGVIDAEGFSPVSAGVYLNIEDTLKYGLDTIYCFQSRITGIKFTNDVSGENISGIKELKLRPVTYGAISTPRYSWKVSKAAVCSIIETSPMEAELSPAKESRDTAIITLNDDANNFSKDIVFINYPPEFPKGEETILAQIKDSRLDEISGIAASVKNPGHYWVHNDSGDDANIYLINTRGYTVATVNIAGITSRDWEDIAVGPGPVDGESYIYVGDIGDNIRQYTYKYVYRIKEPLIDTVALKQNLHINKPDVSAFTFKYADGPRDAEILMIDSTTKDLFIVTKRETHVQIYMLPYPQSETDTLILKKTSVTLPFRMTNGGDISADGTEILIKNLTTVYYWKRKRNETILETLARPAIKLPYIQEPQGESIAWRRDGAGYLTVSEEKNNVIPVLYYYKR